MRPVHWWRGHYEICRVSSLIIERYSGLVRSWDQKGKIYTANPASKRPSATAAVPDGTIEVVGITRSGVAMTGVDVKDETPCVWALEPVIGAAEMDDGWEIAVVAEVPCAELLVLLATVIFVAQTLVDSGAISDPLLS